ncbi:NUDIX domain-containing protein [Candidatus Woesearchaeota archaeon]|nr:NUDIX domain-containing protein [Candidatus Woesearchaeota archaeon]
MEEYLDIVDENNKLLGIKKDRKKVHLDGDFHRTTHVWIINEKNEILCHRRSSFVDLWKEFWDTIFGGHVVSGSDYDETTLKELAEEAGIKAKLSDLILIEICRCIETVDKEKNLVNREFPKVFLCRTRKKISEFNFQKSEISEIKFIPIEELKEIIKDMRMKFVPKPEYYLHIIERIEKIIS